MSNLLDCLVAETENFLEQKLLDAMGKWCMQKEFYSMEDIVERGQ